MNMGVYGAADQASLSPAMAADHPDYDEWIAVGMPECWGYPRQCYGDVDGKAEGGPKAGRYYVHFNDLTLLLAAWGVAEPPQGPGIGTVRGPHGLAGICADFDRRAEGRQYRGLYRVHFRDIDRLLASWNIRELPHGPGLPPDCGGSIEP